MPLKIHKMIIYECLSRRCSDILCQGGRIHFTFFFRNHKYFDIFLHRKTDHIKQLEKNVNQSNFVIHEKKYYFYIFGLCCGRQAKRTQWKKNVWFICIWFFTVVLISLWQQQKKLCSLLLLWLYALFVFDDIFRSRSSMTKKEIFLSTSFWKCWFLSIFFFFSQYFVYLIVFSLNRKTVLLAKAIQIKCIQTTYSQSVETVS